MAINEYFLILGGVLFIYMNLWFIISLLTKRNDVADIAWGVGFVLLAWASFFISKEVTTTGFLVSALVTIWGFRLATHIYNRNKGKPEDRRYMNWRKEWGKWFYLRSYFQIYILQGVLLYLISIPVLVINYSSLITLGVISIVGLMIWLIGFFFEAVGDWQLKQFIQKLENKGRLMTEGLWAYTRHPNYFGEVTQWWGIWVIALSAPLGLISIIGPLTITILILKVSGIPMLEKSMAEHPDFAAYKERVSVFFPLPPNKK